jgi:hypothetical protein
VARVQTLGTKAIRLKLTGVRRAGSFHGLT